MSIRTTVNKTNRTVAYLALGANLGDRADNLRHACDLLSRTDAIEITQKSAIYESESVEDGGEGDFLNAVIRIETSLEPLQLLGAIQSIETQLGRKQPHGPGARPIDIDILLFGSIALETPELTIPHPRMLYRQFVLRPLCDVLTGGWVHPTAERWNT